MRILIATDVPITFVAGSTTFVRTLGALLIARGHEVAVLCPGRYLRGERYLLPEGINVYGAPSVNVLIQDIRLSPPFIINAHIERALSEFKPDILHVQSHFPLPHRAIKMARKRGVAVVGTNHYIPENVVHHLRLPTPIESWLIYLGWKHFHAIFKQIDTITTPTETAAGFMRRSGFPRDVRAVSNGIDTKRFHPNHDVRGLREKYSLGDKPLLLYVGRLDPEKHLEDVLNALPEALRHVDFHFVIVGRGAKRAAWERLASARDIEKNTSFLGFVPDEDLPRLYALADVFVMPGTAELQCIAAMEAMASGKPIIAADALALPELVHHGRNGFLFDPGDERALADHLARLFKDEGLRQRMGSESTRIVARHDIARTLETFEDMYRSAMQKTNSRA